MSAADPSIPFRVLAIDGGGIRGLYSACMLAELARRFAERRNAAALDVGKGFDLIAGTSTGGILACGLVGGHSPERLARLYRTSGPAIFSGERMPENAGTVAFGKWALKHRAKPIHRNEPLRAALTEVFGSETLGAVYSRREIALLVPSVRLLNDSPRVFKTGHLSPDYRKDDNLLLVEICLATAAAPVFLPLATVQSSSNGASEVFADGGLWINNPAIVALLEALEMTETSREIIVVSVGTCPATAGASLAEINLSRGLAGWKCGAKALELSMNVQAAASILLLDRLAKQLGRLGRKVTIVRCPESKPSPEQSRLLGLDNASAAALELLSHLGVEDATQTFQWVQQGTWQGDAIADVFGAMPTKRTTTEI